MNNLDTGLYIVATPIGNLGDLTKRACEILGLVDFIICENPIHSLKLLNNLGIKKKLLSLHDYNEEVIIKRIEKYQHDSSIALISDAGSPLISDPGYNLVINYIKKGLFVTTVPGPSSIISALQLSGLPINKFKFYGFMSKNKASVESTIDELIFTEDTSVIFISGNRLLYFLESIAHRKSINRISICKEMTKKNERVFRGVAEKILEDISHDNKSLKGEFVVIVEGLEKNSPKVLDIKIQEQLKKLLKKFSLTEAVSIVHKISNISKKEIYKTALLIKND